MHDLCYNYVIIDLNKDLQGWLTILFKEDFKWMAKK
jgi:hypothetical protein